MNPREEYDARRFAGVTLYPWPIQPGDILWIDGVQGHEYPAFVVSATSAHSRRESYGISQLCIIIRENRVYEEEFYESGMQQRHWHIIARCDP